MVQPNGTTSEAIPPGRLRSVLPQRLVKCFLRRFRFTWPSFFMEPMRPRKLRRRQGIRFRVRRGARGRPFPPAHKKLSYVARPALLTQGEMAFYRALRRALFGHLGVSFKTRLADILHCPSSLWNTTHGRQIAQKHVDFVLFDPETTAILAVIELDDRSHALQERRRRDLFLNQALHGASIPLLRVCAAAWYDLNELRGKVEKTLLSRRAPVTLMPHRRRIPHNRG